ncbi:MAG: 30S ribosomal protein S4 [Nitrososphaerota archaeon]|nr:30S ribosomal protein S4 [Candidatus Bathyarchaeota archaeon]MDW8048776.1 30S ribosomal protein S4 [Nitrososphaerota archaeon]
MGDPRRQKKKYESPRFPWRSDVLEAELRLLGEYGLRNKVELWRHKTMLSKIRGIARSLLSMPPSERAARESLLLGRLKKLGILSEESVLDNVLDLTVEDILERRLQTLVLRKGLAKTIYQARQLIVHGHIAIGDKKVFSPGYLVPKVEEEKIRYAPTSRLSSLDHPLRQTILAVAKEENAG